MCCGVPGDLLLKNESVLNIRRVLRHLVIHSDSCGCLSPGVKSWLLHHGNAPARTSLLVRNFFANDNTVFTRLGPLRLFLFPNLRRPMKSRRFPRKKDFAGRAQGYTKKCLSEVLRGSEKALSQVYYILTGTI